MSEQVHLCIHTYDYMNNVERNKQGRPNALTKMRFINQILPSSVLFSLLPTKIRAILTSENMLSRIFQFYCTIHKYSPFLLDLLNGARKIEKSYR